MELTSDLELWLITSFGCADGAGRHACIILVQCESAIEDIQKLATLEKLSTRSDLTSLSRAYSSLHNLTVGSFSSCR